MNCYLVKVNTKDKLILHGLHAKGSNSVVIFIHGTGSNFYEEPFIEVFLDEFPKLGIGVITANNRGSGVIGQSWQPCGSALEKFEDCVIDIEEWTQFAMKQGYENIFLAGHSLGTEKAETSRTFIRIGPGKIGKTSLLGDFHCPLKATNIVDLTIGKPVRKYLASGEIPPCTQMY